MDLPLAFIVDVKVTLLPALKATRTLHDLKWAVGRALSLTLEGQNLSGSLGRRCT